MSATAQPAWSIAVKTVGEQSDFAIHVSPDDNLSSMNVQIEAFTGLKASQQRLIYRGRIIQNNTSTQQPASHSVKKEPKVKDVVGLANGQTIHLVPRPEPTMEDGLPELVEQRPQHDPGAATTSGRAAPDSEPSTGTAALLAALLGLGSMDDDSSDENNNASLGQQLARLRSARIRNRSRRPNHRLSSSDLEVPDPGSMEPVRQGLLTLHTIGESLRNTQDAAAVPKHRRWYRGQWIDCRDTVNQWLEATVVEVIQPQDILPVPLQATCSANRVGIAHPTTDPAVSANDVEGRMRLLLEPTDCSPMDGEWGGFQQRDNNEDVNLLLIHYNGWPHRWDEWIRSDSERIRPFRTRTRHPNGSPTACPTPQSHLANSPPTNIKSEIEAEDRAALLPELQRVFTVVTELLEQSVEKNNDIKAPANHYAPWIGGGLEEEMPALLSDAEYEIDSHRPLLGDESASDVIPNEEAKDEERSVGNNVSVVSRSKNPNLKKQLQTLVPLLDRLGRTLTDAAPHLAAYAASLPDEVPKETERTAPGESNVVIAREVVVEPVVLPERRSGLFSLLPVSGRSLTPAPPLVEPSDVAVVSDDEEEVTEPDYVDFASGVVNTTRGEVRTRGGRSSSDEAGLLGAHLAAASLGSLTGDDDGNEGGGLQSLGRLIRQRETNGGNGGGGIDIHIHAIVTGPAAGNTTTMALIGEPQVITPRPTLFSSNSRRSGISEPRIPLSAPLDEEELGIFSDLYSENPAPVDIQNGVLPAETGTSIGFVAPIEVLESLDDHVLRHTSLRSVSPRQRSNAPPPTTPARRGGPVSRLFRRLSRRSLADPDRSFRGL